MSDPEQTDLENMKISGGGPEGTVSQSQVEIAEGEEEEAVESD